MSTTFSNKQYIAIAAVMESMKPNPSERELLRHTYAICKELAYQFGKDNERFDSEQFMRACGWEV